MWLAHLPPPAIAPEKPFLRSQGTFRNSLGYDIETSVGKTKWVRRYLLQRRGLCAEQCQCTGDTGLAHKRGGRPV